MKRLLALVFLFAPLMAFAQSPVVRAHLEPATNITVGQPVRLVVSVFVPNYFTGSLDFPELEVENAIVVLPQDRPAHSNTQIGNATYYGITQTYVIYPQQAGDFHVPPAKLSVPYTITPPKSITAEVSLPAISFHAEIPVAARGLPYFLPTTKLTMTQRWSRPLKDLRTGDTLERTITITAWKMQAMLIPPLTLEQPDGIRIYNGEPSVRDQKTPRGDFSYGQRVQTARYFIEKPGDYTLPAIEVTWWNLATHKTVRTVLPATSFSAVAGPTAQSELPPPQEQVAAAAAPAKPRIHYRSLAVKTAGVLLSIAVVALLLSLFRRIAPSVVERMKRARHSEAACFRSLLRAARSNNAALTYSRMLHWFAVARPGVPMYRALDSGSDVAVAVDAVAAAIYSDHDGLNAWTGDALTKQLREYRRTVIRRKAEEDAPRSLSLLNPGGGPARSESL